MNYKLRFPSFNIKITSYELQHQKHKLRVTTSKAQVTSYKIKSTSYNITGYELRHYTVIHLIKDAPSLKSQFPCKELQVMKKGKLPLKLANRRRTPLLEYFMSSF